MSFGELLVIAIIALFCIEKKDITGIIKYIKQLYVSATKMKGDILSYLSVDQKDVKDFKIEEEIESINFYLQRISNLGHEYNGEYSVSEIKKYYIQIKKDIDHHL